LSNDRKPQQPAWRRGSQQNRDGGRPPRRNDRGRHPRKKPEFQIRPLEVDVRNGDVGQALRVLKKKVADDGLMRELKARRHAEKPSERKRRKAREALKRARKSKGRARRSRQYFQHGAKRSKVAASVPLPNEDLGAS